MAKEIRQVVVTGLGPVTSVGVGCDALWHSLAEGRSNVRRRALPADVGRTAELPLASMPDDREVPGLDKHLAFLASQDCERARDLAYALLAIELALADAGIEYDRERNDIGVIQVFEAPGVERTVCRLFQLLGMPLPTDGPPPVYDLLAPHFYNMQAFLYVHLAGKAMGLHGFSTSVHNACASGAFAVEAAADRIRTGGAEVMIVAGGEAFDTAVRLEWFRRLELYAREAVMRPFDKDPTGFYVGEGAGAIVLESADHAARRGAKTYARYLGGAFAHQGWKQTIPDVRSARLRNVINRALSTADRSWKDVDLIVPHGASTLLSDGYEAACLTQALNGQPTDAVAAVFKPNFGHMLGASGVVETIGLLLAMKNQAVPPTLNASPVPGRLPVPLSTHLTERPVRVALKLSTGFTGHDAAGVFHRT